jgi:hypothetical protein
VFGLLLLAPFLAEALPGATPPVLFVLFPPIAVWQIGLYGCGALLVREVARRWKGGWRTILLLGAAYGLVEEGLSLKVIFNPNFEPAGALATYGRVAELSSVFALQVVVYHAVVSITVPIMLAELIYEDKRERLWLGRRSMLIAGLVWLGALVFGFTAVHPEPPPPLPYAVVCAAVLALVVAARQMAVPSGERVPRPSAARLVSLFLLGLVGTAVFLGVSWSGPEAGRPPEITLVLQLTLLVACGWLLRHLDSAAPLDRLEQLALASGVAGFFVLTALSKPAGGPIIAVVFALALTLLGRRLYRQRSLDNR